MHVKTILSDELGVKYFNKKCINEIYRLCSEHDMTLKDAAKLVGNSFKAETNLNNDIKEDI